MTLMLALERKGFASEVMEESSMQQDHGPPSGPPPMQPAHGPVDRATMRLGPPGKWWSNPRIVETLGLTADQQQRMDGVFYADRPKLIDLSAALQKEEAALEPMLAVDRPAEPAVLAQIDRIAQARAELEKGNARMLLAFRGILTQDQWKRLKNDSPGRRSELPPPRP